MDSATDKKQIPHLKIISIPLQLLNVFSQLFVLQLFFFYFASGR